MLRIFFLALTWFLLEQWILGDHFVWWLILIFALFLAASLWKRLPSKVFLINIFVWFFLNLAALNFFPFQAIAILGALGFLVALKFASDKNLLAWQTFSLTTLFFAFSLVWFFMIGRDLDFWLGILIMIFLSFLSFWQSLLVSLHFGELAPAPDSSSDSLGEFKKPVKRDLFIFSVWSALALGELGWVLSFLPFSFFVLAGVFSSFWNAWTEILKYYFRGSLSFKVIYKNILLVFLVATLLLLITPWLPRR